MGRRWDQVPESERRYYPFPRLVLGKQCGVALEVSKLAVWRQRQLGSTDGWVRCRLAVVPGSDCCWQHGGRESTVRRTLRHEVQQALRWLLRRLR